jgi:hypothetical protein
MTVQLPIINKSLSLKTIVVFSIFLHVISLAAAWKYIYNSPDVVLDRAIKNSLQVKSVTKIADSSTEANTNRQASVLSYQPSFGVQSLYTIKQDTDGKNVYNQTEVLGFKKADYVRYKALETPQIDANKKAEIINQWAKVSADPTSTQQPSTLNDTMLNLVLFGDIGKKSANKVAKDFQKSGAYTIESYKTKFSRGHHVMELKVNVNPKRFVQVLKDNQQSLNYIDTSSLSVDDATENTVATTIVVDVLSGQVMQVVTEGSKSEDYAAYGLYRTINIPTEFIPFQDFAKKVQALQKQQ